MESCEVPAPQVLRHLLEASPTSRLQGHPFAVFAFVFAPFLFWGHDMIA